MLGTGAAFPRAGSACSGYLIRTAKTTIWLDAGNGTFSRLQQQISFDGMDAIVLSHSHADHIADVTPLMYALGYETELSRELPVDIYAPAEVAPMISGSLGEGSKDIFDRVFRFHELGGPFQVKDIKIEPFRVVHPVETFGFRISDGSKLLVYTADTALFDGLAGHCRGADLFICEATYVHPVTCPPGIHMWADESGKLATEVGAPRTLLTHVWGSISVADAVKEAAGVADVRIEAAVEGETYEL